MNNPRISVLIVCDFVSVSGKHWDDETKSLEAFSAQDIEEPFEIILADFESYADSYPDALRARFPDVKVHFLPVTSSIGLVDAGIEFCSGELIAITEADSIPEPDWLRLLVSAIDRYDPFDIVSGLTTYTSTTALRRVMNLIDRAYIDTGKLGPCGHYAPNGAVYRRRFLEKEYPALDETPFVAQHFRHNRVLESGVKYLLEPAAVMVHEFGGLPFVCDVARQKGHQAGRMEILEGMRSGTRFSIFVELVKDQFRYAFRDFQRVGSRYLRWYDYPLYFAMLLFTRLYSAPSIWKALAGKDRIEATGYR